jgi:hypothetical protein
MGRGLGEKQQYIMEAFRQAKVLNVFEISELLWKWKLRKENKEPFMDIPTTLRSSREIRHISAIYRMMTSLVRRGLVAYPAKVRPREWYLAKWEGDRLQISLTPARKAAWVWVHYSRLYIRCKEKWWLLEFEGTSD